MEREKRKKGEKEKKRKKRKKEEKRKEKRRKEGKKKRECFCINAHSEQGRGPAAGEAPEGGRGRSERLEKFL